MRVVFPYVKIFHMANAATEAGRLSGIYPHIEGVAGIGFADVLSRVDQGQTHEEVIKGGSGQEMRLIHSRKKLIVENMEGTLWMRASMEPRYGQGALLFDLKTKLSAEECFNGKASENRHDDMFAGKFIDFALEYFEVNGENITTCIGRLQEGTEVYDEYEKELEKTGGNRSKAAMNTWPGRKWAERGYVDAVVWDIPDRDGSIVMEFYKPQPSLT